MNPSVSSNMLRVQKNVERCPSFSWKIKVSRPWLKTEALYVKPLNKHENLGYIKLSVKYFSPLIFMQLAYILKMKFQPWLQEDVCSHTESTTLAKGEKTILLFLIQRQMTWAGEKEGNSP